MYPWLAKLSNIARLRLTSISFVIPTEYVLTKRPPNFITANQNSDDFRRVGSAVAVNLGGRKAPLATTSVGHESVEKLTL